MKPTSKLWLVAVAAVLVLSRDSRGAVREVPPSGVSTFLDAFPQTLRLRATMGVGVLPSDTTWEFLAPGVRPTPMWVPETNGPAFAFPILEASDSGLYRAIAVEGWKVDEAQVRLSVAGPAVEVDALRLQSPLQNTISALLSLPDGRVVRAGRFFTTGDGAGLGLALHRADGSRDPSWDGLADVSSMLIRLDDKAGFFEVLLCVGAMPSIGDVTAHGTRLEGWGTLPAFDWTTCEGHRRYSGWGRPFP